MRQTDDAEANDMRARLGRIATGVVVAAGALIGIGAAAGGARAETAFARFDVSSSGAPVSVLITQEDVYRVVVTGTYNYGTTFPNAFADAECSTDAPVFDGVVDFAVHAVQANGGPSLYPSPLSEWQRYRYTLAPKVPPFFSNNPADDALDVYIDGSNVEWRPLSPTPVDGGPGVVAGCDLATHTYESAQYLFRGNRRFSIFDPNVRDNAGSLHVEIYKGA
jgi:hypothetical protein